VFFSFMVRVINIMKKWLELRHLELMADEEWRELYNIFLETISKNEIQKQWSSFLRKRLVHWMSHDRFIQFYIELKFDVSQYCNRIFCDFRKNFHKKHQLWNQQHFKYQSFPKPNSPK
jgi:hypothetical protein